MKPVIQINDVCKRFGRCRVLDGVTFDVAPGDAVALWGSNGVGKTTLIRCLLGLVDFGGDIRVAGYDVRRQGKRVRRLLGYVPQELAFHEDFRVIEVVRCLARIRGAAVGSCESRLARFGLLNHARKRVRELSGGMRQRLALAVALLNDPPILVLDEPTSNLDSVGRRSLMDQLLDLKATGQTILFISHRPEEVHGLADRVLTLESGRVIADEPAAGSRLRAAADEMDDGSLLDVPVSRFAPTSEIRRLP